MDISFIKVEKSPKHIELLYVCTNCNYHERIGSEAYFALLFDKNKFTELIKIRFLICFYSTNIPYFSPIWYVIL